MLDLNVIAGFDWDDGNLIKNKKKHGVEIQECEEIFFNQPILIKRDFKHSANERRAIAMGITNQKRLLFVVFTLRGDLIRIISARDVNSKERKIYEEN